MTAPGTGNPGDNVLAAAHAYTAGCDGLHPIGEACPAITRQDDL